MGVVRALSCQPTVTPQTPAQRVIPNRYTQGYIFWKCNFPMTRSIRLLVGWIFIYIFIYTLRDVRVTNCLQSILIGIAKLKFIRCLMQGKFSLFAKLIFSVIIFSLIISTTKKSWPFKSYVMAIKKNVQKNQAQI